MESVNKFVKVLLYTLIVVLLFLPLIQKEFDLFHIRPLKGAIENAENPKFDKETWLDGSYQVQKEKYLKDSIGFKEIFIRLYNQMNYTLFDKTTARSVVIGEDGYLYENDCILSYLGFDFIGEEIIKDKLAQFKDIVEVMEMHGTYVAVLLAPGKGGFYPDYFPPKYAQFTPKEQTNYEIFKRKLVEKEIPVMDVHNWFLEMKNTVHKEKKLYSKTGIHWSKYGEYLVADSLLKFLNVNTGCTFPEIVLDTIIVSKELRYTDNDLWKGMNLLVRFPDFTMHYPYFHPDSEAKNTTKVLVIADSYYWGMYNFGMSKDYFSDSQFWFYYFNRHPEDNIPSGQKINIKEEVKKYDIVLFVNTDANLPRFGFGFLEEWMFAPTPTKWSPN